MIIPVLILIIVTIAAGCSGISPDVRLPRVKLVQSGGPDPGDCFFRINDSAHSGGPGSAGLVIISGYALNTCNRPMANLVVRGTLLDPAGNPVAVAETPKTVMGSGDIVAYSLVFDTPGNRPFTYRLVPVIRNPAPLF